MTTNSTGSQTGVRSDLTSRLLELAEFLGLGKETEALRGDLRTERILPRLKRALDLLGLPISTGHGVPGIAVTLLERAIAGWPAGSVAVEWRPGASLIALDDEADAGDAVDRFTRGVVTSVEEALGAVLRRSGLRVQAAHHAEHPGWPTVAARRLAQAQCW
ncbi:hypothetical protein [Kitasatospora sp. NPDC056531]|uniref:hypothetical protein n=1 Tax=Kitasatospora sp. NPDC056531 TaxID=3345856 RepID=UPI0036B8F3E8